MDEVFGVFRKHFLLAAAVSIVGCRGTPGSTGKATQGTTICAEANTAPNTKECLACEAKNCPHDKQYQPFCEDFASPGDRARCQAVLDCVRSTNCIAFGNVACYCGSDISVPDCKSKPPGPSGAHGKCLEKIKAAFPAGSDSNTIVNSIGDVSSPGGAALSLGQCDFEHCGDPGNYGHSECIPYCKFTQ